MRVILQRVKYSSVRIQGEVAGKTERGLLALVGMNSGDNRAVFDKMIDKITNLRIFEDGRGKMNLSVRDIEGGILLVPNFTLYSNCRHGRRPDFAAGARPEEAKRTFEEFTELLKASFPNTETGVFGADMQVELLNDGPVTIILDSDELMGGKV
ncbi:MAG: D-tyrosyl-tRNA(Tyr) deacylase [Clostridiales bacterium]|nr:D-tyrosyl-tRNA(Tyr) deacylase [Clostridiales bacterium]